MAQFDVYALDEIYLLDCQADLLSHLATRSVAPLFPRSMAVQPTQRLNPVFTIDGEPYILMPQLIAAFPAKQLIDPTMSLLNERDRIMSALDMLLTGY